MIRHLGKAFEAPKVFACEQDVEILKVLDPLLNRAFQRQVETFRGVFASIGWDYVIGETIHFPAERTIRFLIPNYPDPGSMLHLSDAWGFEDYAVVMRNFSGERKNGVWFIVQIMKREDALKLKDQTSTYKHISSQLSEPSQNQTPGLNSQLPKFRPAKSSQSKSKRKSAKKARRASRK